MSTQPDNIAMNIIDILDLGVSPFKEVWDLQKELVKKRQNGQINDTLILAEHEPVYTLGKNADENHILQNTPRDVKTYQIERGGDVTFHGPGQLVGYPILDLHNYKKSISCYMRGLEQLIIDTLAEFTVMADRKDGLTGVWVGDEKIAALGVRVTRWITMHGFSLNVAPDLTYYSGIIPCGIFEYGVTSMAKLLTDEVTVDWLKQVLIGKFMNQLLTAKSMIG
jgi:lipoate-protein ligase B